MYSEMLSGPCQISKLEFLWAIISGYKMLNNYAKVTIMFDIVLNVVLNITKFNKSYPEQ